MKAVKPVRRGKYNRYIWEQEHIDFLRSNWPKMTNKELADALGINLTKCREKLYELGMKRMEMEYWSPEQVEWLKSNYKMIGDTEIAERFNEMWPKKKKWTKQHIENKRQYMKLKRTAEDLLKIHKRNVETGRFSMCAVKSWEKRGTSHIGTIKIWRTTGRPVAVIKTENGYVHYNRWLFENTYFTLPSHILVTTRSGKIVAEGPEDLMIIDRAENARNNRAMPKELLPTKNLLRQIEKELINR